MKEITQKILELAVNSPSGDNSQPWRFEVIDNKIFVFNLPKSDNPILNINQRGSYIGHGALLENIFIAATKYKISTKIDLFPEINKKDLVAIVTLIVDNSISPDPLVSYLVQRHTNRRKYKNISLTVEQKQEIEAEIKKIDKTNILKFLIAEDKQTKRIIGQALSSIESVILQHEGLHSLLFKDIIWSSKEFNKLRKGFYIGTMEFNPIQKFVFFLASKWSRIQILNKLGLAKMVASEDAKLYATGSALCAITIESDTKENFIQAGRLMERIWLKTTSYGLSFHPVTALNFARLRIAVGEHAAFNDKQTKKIIENYEVLLNSFKVSNGLIALTFRIGSAPHPRAIALKLPPRVKYIP